MTDRTIGVMDGNLVVLRTGGLTMEVVDPGGAPVARFERTKTTKGPRQQAARPLFIPPPEEPC